MAKKTVIRRLFKYLPVSIELQTAVTLDERADAGLDQDNASILTGEYSVVDDQSQDQVPDGVNTETGEVTEPAPGQQSDTGDTGDDGLNLE
ncbi:recombination protein RecT, partial [Pseudomonas aeruginosa]